MPQAGGSRGDDEPNRRGGGLPHARMAQQEQGMPRRESAAMQALGRREVERLRTAPNLEQNGGQRVEVRGLFGDPQRIDQFFGLGHKQVVRQYPETSGKTRRIGPAGLAKNLPRADPDYNARPAGGDAGQSQSEAGRGTGVSCGGTMDFGQARSGEPTAQTGVETRSPAGKGLGDRPSAPSGDQPIGPIAWNLQPFRQNAFDLRDFMAQGKNDPLRQCGLRHGVRT